jgi:hypothetical protein
VIAMMDKVDMGYLDKLPHFAKELYQEGYRLKDKVSKHYDERLKEKSAGTSITDNAPLRDNNY